MLLMHFFIFIRFSNESNIFEYNIFFFLQLFPFRRLILFWH